MDQSGERYGTHEVWTLRRMLSFLYIHFILNLNHIKKLFKFYPILNNHIRFNNVKICL